jgi:ribose 5-phosphate isomerase
MASTTYNAVGNKELWDEILTTIDMDNNIVINKMKRFPIAAMSYNWLTDDTRPPKDNAQLEKHDFATVEATPRRDMMNYVQFLEHGYWVTDAQRKVEKHGGVGDEFKHQMTKALREIAGDWEKAVFKSNSRNAGSSGTAPRAGGMKYFLETALRLTFTAANATNLFTVSGGHDLHMGEQVTVYTLTGTLPTGLTQNNIYYVGGVASSTFTSTTFKLYLTREDAMADSSAVDISADGSGTLYVTSVPFKYLGAALNETTFNDIMEAIKKNGGAATKEALLGTKAKRLINTWTLDSQRTMDASNNKLKVMVDVFEGDFGIVELTIHFMQDDTVIDFVDWQYWRLGMFDNFHTEEVARKGTYTEGVIVGGYTVECRAPSVQGRMAGITWS